ncbi:5555_t:CDS:10 [Entrophospora sp. SA101]|nr:5555_t:CDS:10 [Entrophospora sp. SA101]
MSKLPSTRFNYIICKNYTAQFEYEAYFRYREKDFKLVEYLIYHLFYGKITHFNYNEKKEEFYKAYNLYKKKYEGGKPELISEADKMSLEPFINLLVQIKNNFTKSHVLSIRVINKLKEFGWVDINPLENEDVSSAYKRLKMKKIWANNEYKKRSKHINELTFSHDFMERPFNTDDLNVQEIFFGELSNGPFATDLTHVKNDNTKLGKLGKDSLDRIKRTLFIQDISIILMKHHIEGSCLNRIQIEKIGKRIQLQLPGNTRWGSHYFCLNSIIASKKALQVVVFENAVQRTITPELISKLVDTNSFWPATELLCSFLKLFVDMFKIFESDKPNLSSVYNEFIILGNEISKSTIPIKDEVLDIYNHYNEKLYHPAIAIAYFFDPRYKGKYLPDRISSISYIVEETDKEIMEYHAKSSRFSSNFLWLKEAIEDPITWWSSLEKDVPILKEYTCILDIWGEGIHHTYHSMFEEARHEYWWVRAGHGWLDGERCTPSADDVVAAVSAVLAIV